MYKRIKKKAKTLLVLCAFAPTLTFAQTSVDSNLQDSSVFKLNIMGRSSFNLGKENNAPLHAGFKMDDIRLLLSGQINADLHYKVRYRLNRALSTTDLDNASRALDFAQVNYRFGKQKSWELALGKQAAMVGSYEFNNNPIYEYAFSDHVNRILNLFVVGATLSYKVSPSSNVHLQFYNTSNESLGQVLKNANYSAGNFQQSTRPIGTYLTWEKSYLDKKITTKWSYNYAQLVACADNHGLALANMYKTGRSKVYLDLQYSHYDVDHLTLASNPINQYYGRLGAERTMANAISYTSAILRADQQLTRHWGVSLKGAFETASARKDKQIGEYFRHHWTYFGTVAYMPVPTKDWKIFTGYVGNHINYKKHLGLASESNNRFILGTYFNLGAL